MPKVDNKKNEWKNALNSIVSNKNEHLKTIIIDYLVYLDEKYKAGISYKITNVPDLRFLTKIGKQRHFFLVRKSFEIHIYLNNPLKILQEFPFIREKESPKNHFQIIGKDVGMLSSYEMEKLIFESFCYISEIDMSDNDHTLKIFSEYSEYKKDQFIPTKNDVEKAMSDLGNIQANLDEVILKVKNICQNKGIELSDNWEEQTIKNIEKWFAQKK